MKITFIGNSLRVYGGLEKWHIFVGNLLSANNSVNMVGVDMGDQKRVDYEEINHNIKFDYDEISKDKISEYFTTHKDTDIVYLTIGDRSVIDKVLSNYKGKIVFGAHHSEYVYYSGNDGIDWGKDFLSLKGWKNKVWIKRLVGVLHLFNGVHILNPALEYWKEFNPSILLLPNTTDIQPIETSKYDVFSITFYGRHEKMKGTRTVEYIAKNIPKDIILNIIGSGNESRRLSKYANGNVRFYGQVSEETLKEIVAKSHLILFPSYMENSSLIPLESFKLGTPILARDTNFNRWLKDYPLCLLASKDSDFLMAIKKNKEIWESNPSYYLEQSNILKRIPMSVAEYKMKFENFLNSALEGKK